MPGAMERILIGVAWPYANGDLHLGHVAGSLLGPDIFARFHRMRGNDVLMVSGSDEHGTPITVTAEEEGVDPQDVVDRYHEQHVDTLDELGISFDMFTRTSTDHHRERVHEIFQGLDEQGFIETRDMTAPYDPKAKRFLPDRFVEGTCPHCEAGDARGDQCDACGKMLDADELVEPRSTINPEVDVEFRETTHWFFKLSDFQDRLEDYVADKDHWRSNVRKFTQNWLNEGLEDRAVTRDLTWGIPVPDEDPMWDDKRIYVWFEAVCGYLTASMYWAKQEAEDPDAWRRFWEEGYDDVDTRSYYFLAKDNIPFHTIIWPAILAGCSDAREAEGRPRLNLPYDVPGNEYLNLSGEQFSKSRGVGIWARDVLEEFETDAIRYYLAVNMPETRDADWTWGDFLSKVNNELVAAYGNFVHRTLSLIHAHVGRIPEAGEPTSEDQQLVDELEATHAEVTGTLAEARFKEPLREIMQLARAGNRYIDAQQPWSLADEDPERAGEVLHHCARLCRGLAILTAPYLPHSAQRLWEALGQEGSVHEADWTQATAELEPGTPIDEPEPLFEKLDEDEVMDLVAPDEDETGEDQEDDDMSQISFEDFQDVDMRIGRVTSVEDHPDADKLYVVEVDLGDETRQLVAGLKNLVEPATLEDLEVVVVANLEPATIRGVESQGMLLAAEADEDTVSPLTTVDDLDPGAKVR
jgi:methionyl-tRNA synthetase